jgi:signal transduction histidine kinase
LSLKRNSLGVKTFIYLITFSIAILFFMWVFQLGFLKISYERYRLNTIKSAAEEIVKYKGDLNSKLQELAYNSDICVELYSGDDVTDYNTMNKDCILRSKNLAIIEAKNDLLSSTDKQTLLTVEDPRFNSKSLIYGIKVDDDTYIMLNTKLEDVNSTTYVLRNQLIYITLLVIILAIAVSYFVSKMLNKPIISITKKAKKMADGNYEPDLENYNIAEIDDLKNTLNYARSEIKNTDQLRRDLMANVSHDLKTPLTMIKAYAEMARDINGEKKEKREENLNVIIDEADRLNVLVNDILELSKMQNGSQKLSIDNYDLIKELNDILKRYEIIKETEKYKIILNAPSKAIVEADKNKINQVIYNLINNAINYTGADLTVNVNITEEKNRYLVEIIDSGKGISKEDLNLIWTKYYKNEKNHQRNVVGTGLGLNIVQSILTEHKFEFGVKSKKGKGSNFYFYIKKGKIS